MTEHYWTPQSNVSNETSTNKTFQRTISAQVSAHRHAKVLYMNMMRHTHTPPPVLLLHKHTHSYLLFMFSAALSQTNSARVCVCVTLQDTLAYATALLNEKEQSGSSNGSDGSPANENADRSLRQVLLSHNQLSCLDQRGSLMTHAF